MEIHTYNNGVACYRDTIYPQALARYAEYINLHEPFEETVFEHIIRNGDIDTFVDVGSAWGYYSILAKKRKPSMEVYGLDPDTAMCANATKIADLNDVHVEFINGAVPHDFTLDKVVKDVGGVDLIKIDVQGAATDVLRSGLSSLNAKQIRNFIIGTHGQEHMECLQLLTDAKHAIKLNLVASKIPIQPDGLIWATACDS